MLCKRFCVISFTLLSVTYTLLWTADNTSIAVPGQPREATQSSRILHSSIRFSMATLHHYHISRPKSSGVPSSVSHGWPCMHTQLPSKTATAVTSIPGNQCNLQGMHACTRPRPPRCHGLHTAHMSLSATSITCTCQVRQASSSSAHRPDIHTNSEVHAPTPPQEVCAVFHTHSPPL